MNSLSDVEFESTEDENRYLRSLLSVHRLADNVLEDCLVRRLPLETALDVFVTQCARLVRARGSFVIVRHGGKEVVTRRWGEVIDLARFAHFRGSTVVAKDRTCFVTPLAVGRLDVGALGFVVPEAFEDGSPRIMAMVEAVGEVLDSAVATFLAQTMASTPTEPTRELPAAAHAFGKFDVVATLGTGGMAQVVVARENLPGSLTRLVALKRMLPAIAETRKGVDQFLDEARLCLKLSHENVVTVFEVGQHDGSYFLSMEWVRGVGLDTVIEERSPVPRDVVSAAVCGAAAGLHAAHELRGDDGRLLDLVHRDASTHNIMVGFDGRVKVVDFGVAKAREQKTLTVPGIVKGKPLYMSPEQARGDDVDRRTDIFALGLVLYEGLTGKPPFERENDVKSMLAIINEPLPRPSDISEELWAVLCRALAKKAYSRFETAEDFKEALARAVKPASPDRVGEWVRAAFPDRYSLVREWEAAEPG